MINSFLSDSIWSVSELNRYVGLMLEGDLRLSSVFIKGEISNLKIHSVSGHIYFCLKDFNSSVKAIMFRSNAMKMLFVPTEGMKVIVKARPSLYEKDGSFQIYVEKMEPDGIGALYLAYEQLKSKLQHEGLFDSAHKKNLPKFPQRIGVITSATGAAFQDISKVLKRRYPIASILLYPSLVQGNDAAIQLKNGIEWFDKKQNVDVIIIGRGGGSFEDLFAFNDEKLAYAIYQCTIPVVSAVGHETDFTICDMVADVRAATPSAAAELVSPCLTELKQKLEQYHSNILNDLKDLIKFHRQNFLFYVKNVYRKSIEIFLNNNKNTLSVKRDNINNSIKQFLFLHRQDLAMYEKQLEALNPNMVLKRGYSVIVSQNKKIITSLDDLKIDDEISLLVSDGTLKARITSINKENDNG